MTSCPDRDPRRLLKQLLSDHSVMPRSCLALTLNAQSMPVIPIVSTSKFRRIAVVKASVCTQHRQRGGGGGGVERLSPFTWIFLDAFFTSQTDFVENLPPAFLCSVFLVHSSF